MGGAGWDKVGGSVRFRVNVCEGKWNVDWEGLGVGAGDSFAPDGIRERRDVRKTKHAGKAGPIIASRGTSGKRWTSGGSSARAMTVRVGEEVRTPPIRGVPLTGGTPRSVLVCGTLRVRTLPPLTLWERRVLSGGEFRASLPLGVLCL